MYGSTNGMSRSATHAAARFVAVLLVACFFAACRKTVAPFSVAYVDQQITGTSAYPLAKNVRAVGHYAGLVKSGAGYFYDEVLEYRVWLHPENGAENLAGDKDYFASFAQFERALDYSKKHRGAEPPLVLVRQRESINEPTPGRFVWERHERVTEWRVPWLASSLRRPDSITKFLATHDRALQ